MPLPQYVTRRGQRLYYRRAYPKELWPVTGPAPFARSLRTEDAREALRARPEAERRYDAKVDAAREKLARLRERPPLTKADAEALAVRWFLGALDTAEEFSTVTAKGPEAALKAAEDARWSAGEGRRALAEGDLWHRRALAERLRDSAGYASEPLADDVLLRLIARASIAADEVVGERALGRYGARPKDPLFAAAMEAPAPELRKASSASPKAAGGQTIADLERAYRRIAFPRFAPSTQQAHEPVFRVLREVLGGDTPLDSIGHDEGEKLFDAVKAMPANARKQAALEGLTIPEAIEKGKRLGLRTLSPKTINDGYMGHLSAVFSFAIARGWMRLNPAKGLRVRDEPAGAKRDPFRDRLNALFGAAPWSPPDKSGEGSPIRYWAPILALFHGLRLGEIAGLEVQDIGKEQGQPMLFVRPSKRGVKTAAANRDLPLHPELVRLGFPDFVEARKATAAPEDALFEGEGPSPSGKWGVALGRWFIRRVKALGLEGRKLTFHALRHDFQDALREAEIDETLAKYLMGHARSGMGAVYGGRPSLARLRGAVRKVQFEGLKLPS